MAFWEKLKSKVGRVAVELDPFPAAEEISGPPRISSV